MESTLPRRLIARPLFSPANLVFLTVLAVQRPRAVSLLRPLRHFRARPLILQLTGRHRHIRLSNNNIGLAFLPNPICSLTPQITIIAKERQIPRSPHHLLRSFRLQ